MNYSKKKNVKKKIFAENTDQHALNNHKETTIQSQETTKLKQTLTEFIASPKSDQSLTDKAYNPCISRAFWLSA